MKEAIQQDNTLNSFLFLMTHDFIESEMKDGILLTEGMEIRLNERGVHSIIFGIAKFILCDLNQSDKDMIRAIKNDQQRFRNYVKELITDMAKETDSMTIH